MSARPTGSPPSLTTEWRIEHGDALHLLPTIERGSVALVLTSPPYNLAKPYEDTLDVAEYISWLSRLVELAAETLTPNGAIWLNLGFTSVGHARVPIAYLLWPHLPRSLTLNQAIVWTYQAGVACKRWLSPRHEDLLWLVRNPHDYRFELDRIRDPNVRYPNARRHGRLRNHPDGKNPSSHWAVPKLTSGRGRSSPERLPHPAQMPQEIAERIVLACSNPGDLVLDFAAGVATTIAAAVTHGRRGLGIEIREDYCAYGRQRLLALERIRDR